jgi:HEPN domain-containing protein
MRRGERWLWILAGVLLAGSLCTEPGRAQSGRDKVRLELEQTERILDRAVEHARENGCERAKRLIDSARELQQRARGAFLRNTNESMREALSLTEQARKVAAEAIRTCQVEFKAHEVVRNLFDATRELASEAAVAVRASGDAQAEHLYQAGLNQLEKAQDAYRSEHYRQAIRLATVANTLIERSLRRVRGPNAAGGEGAGVQEACDRTGAQIGELKIALAGEENEEAAALLAQAETQQKRALDLLHEGKPREALRWTERARSTALEASWKLRTSLLPETVERGIEVVSQMISDLAPGIRADGGDEARALLKEAEDQLSAARSDLSRGETDPAAASARRAASLIQRAAEASGLK